MGDPRTMVKKVNVIANIPVRTISPAMQGKYFGIAMTPANILKCLNARAIVDEILPDGTKVRLTKKNYNQDNTPKVEEKVPEPDVLKSAVSEEDMVAKGKIIKGTEESAPVESIEENLADIQGVEEIPEEIIEGEYPVEVHEIDHTEVAEATELIVEEGIANGDEPVYATSDISGNAMDSILSDVDTSDTMVEPVAVVESVAMDSSTDTGSSNKYIQQYNKSKKRH